MPPGDSDSPAEHDHLVDTPHMVAAPLSKSRPGPSPIVLAADSSDAAAAAAAAAATVAAGQSLPMPPPPPPPPTPPPMPGVAEAVEPGATPVSVPHSSSTHTPPPSTAHSAHISPRRPLLPTSPEAAATAHPAATTPAATSVAHPSAVSAGGRSAAEVGGGACPTTASPALASADVSGTDLPRARGSGGVRHEAEAAAPPALSEGGTAEVPRQGSNRLSRRSTPQQLPHQGEEATTTTSAVQQPRSLATSTPAAAAAGAAVEAGTSYLPRGSLGEVREARSDPHTASSLPQPHDRLSRPDSKRSHRSTTHAPAAAAPPPPPQPTGSESCGGGGGGFKPVDDAASSCAGGGGGSRLPSLAEALASFELHELAGVGGGGSAATPTTAPPSAPHSRITPSLRGDGAFATTAAAAAVSPPQRTPHNAAPQSSSSSSSSLREEITRLSQAVPPAAPCGATRSPAAASHDLPSVSSIPAAATSSSSPAAAAATAATPAAPAAPGVPPPRTGARQPPLGGGGGGGSGSGSRGFTGVQHGLRRATPVWDADPDKTRAYVRTPVFEGADKPTMPRMYAPLHKATVETAAATAKATAAAACSPPYSPLSPNRQAMRIRTPQDTKSGAPTDAAVAAAAAGGSAFRHDVRAVTPPPLDDQACFPYDLELAALADEQRTRLHTLYQQKVLTREQYKAARRKVNEASRHNTTVASLSPERNREHRRVLE